MYNKYLYYLLTNIKHVMASNVAQLTLLITFGVWKLFFNLVKYLQLT